MIATLGDQERIVLRGAAIGDEAAGVGLRRREL
jgi:hypothetical protein